jgi:hypothetical protein
VYVYGIQGLHGFFPHGSRMTAACFPYAGYLPHGGHIFFQFIDHNMQNPGELTVSTCIYHCSIKFNAAEMSSGCWHEKKSWISIVKDAGRKSFIYIGVKAKVNPAIFTGRHYHFMLFL